MDRRDPYRTASPAHPIQPGYQLDDNPYGRQQNLDMPPAGTPQRYGSPNEYQRYGTPIDHRMGTPSDNLALNAPVSCTYIVYVL